MKSSTRKQVNVKSNKKRVKLVFALLLLQIGTVTLSHVKNVLWLPLCITNRQVNAQLVPLIQPMMPKTTSASPTSHALLVHHSTQKLTAARKYNVLKISLKWVHQGHVKPVQLTQLSTSIRRYAYQLANQGRQEFVLQRNLYGTMSSLCVRLVLLVNHSTSQQTSARLRHDSMYESIMMVVL